MADTKDPLKDVFPPAPAKTAPAPVKKTRQQIRRENEAKYAQVCRQETPLAARSGQKLAARGSGNCADHKTNGREL